MKVKGTALFILAVFLIGLLGYASVAGFPWFYGKYILGAKQAIRFGLDLKGGVVITYQPAGNVKPTSDQMDTVKGIMRTRLDAKNYLDANVTTSSSNRVIVEIPNLTDPQAAVNELGQTAMLELIDPQGQPATPGQLLTGGQVILTGTDVKGATSVPTQSGGWEITFNMTPAAQAKFAEATSKLAPTNAPIAITLDRFVISAPTVSSRIDSPSAQITGTFTEAEAKNLAMLISSGALPFKLESVDTRYIGPTLGKNALDISWKAGLIGLILVALFMMIWYRVPGIAAVIALIGYTAAILFIFARTKLTLTLPGIAGVILSIGVAVDANVIIFERIKEELRSGKSLRAAISTGFKRALPPIIDANVTTFISAVVLLIFGTGPIQGFAWALLIGVVVSMVSAILVTRFLVNRMYDMGIVNSRLYGAKGDKA